MPSRAPTPDQLRGIAFTTSMAARLGVPPRRLRNGTYERLFRGVYVLAGTPISLELRCQAALLTTPPGTVVSHRTALALTGLGAMGTSDAIDVTSPPDRARPRHQPGLRVHERSTGSVAHATGPLAVPVSGAARTLVDMAALLKPDELVVAGDHLVARFGGLDELVRAMRAESGRRYVVTAREALRHVREGVDSPQETRLRLRIVAFGLPEPEVNLVVRDALGGWLGRAELGYRRERVLLQYEGDAHRTNSRRWRQDIARDESYVAEGWRVLRATADDVLRPARFCRRLEQALRQAPEGRERLPRGDLGGSAA